MLFKCVATCAHLQSKVDQMLRTQTNNCICAKHCDVEHDALKRHPCQNSVSENVAFPIKFDQMLSPARSQVRGAAPIVWITCVVCCETLGRLLASVLLVAMKYHKATAGEADMDFSLSSNRCSLTWVLLLLLRTY